MYLKKIEILGFKSFKEKIKLNFSPGVTAIVGPNGSGKSNIVDGIRWVLGEQNAKSLRGANMQDIIFSGSKGSKPLGLASVALVLDNKDGSLNVPYEEVTVTRKIYRSGESEYLLNNTVCRLKDITELFMDTGVGKDGYSIIGQGDIEQLLKSNQRRTIFEEATGINKHKTRKDLTISKLEKEEENLKRLHDIIKEVESNLPRLEVSSRKAKEFLKLNEQLKLLKVNIFLKEETKIEEDLKKTQSNLENISEQINSENEKKDFLQNHINEVKNRLKTTNGIEETLKKQLFDNKILQNEKQNSIPVFQEQIKNIISNIIRLTEQIENKKDNTLELEKYEQEYKNLSIQLKEKDEKEKEIAIQLLKLTNEITELESLQEEHTKIEYRLNITTQNETKYSKAVQLILSQKQNGKIFGIIDSVGNLIQTKLDFQTAIDISLGGSSQNIVVENEKTATDCINYLKKNNLGRATFLPLTKISYHNKNKVVPQANGVIGLAKNLASYDIKYQSIVNMLLSDVLIVDNIENATKINTKDYRIVTLDGEIIAKSGAMTGGSISKESIQLAKTLKSIKNRIGDRDIKSLRSQKEHLQNELTNLKIDKNTISRQIEFNNQLSKQLEQGQQNSESIKEQIIKFEQEKLDKEQSIKDIETEVKSISFKSEDITYQIQHTEKEKQSFLTTLSDLDSDQKDQVKLSYDLQNELNRLKHMQQTLTEKKQNIYNEIWEEYEITYTSAKTYENLYLPIESLKEKERNVKNEIRILGPISIDSIEEYDSVKERYDFLSKQKLDIDETISKLKDIIEKLTEEMEQQFQLGISDISNGFDQVFKQMFGGGTASLRMSDSNDVLNSDIEIVAQPPGKKLTNLSLMSLGEKTLTAISLLFSILQTRPSPFILLDEIEAPLDHANNIKFSNFIKTFNKNSSNKMQFILITHKRPTMEAANNIYGITMRDGVTGVVHMELGD